MKCFGIGAIFLAGLLTVVVSAPAKANVVYSLDFDSYGGTLEGTD